jgi:tripartite-type tricarboxylate transporter receptor subunit TctC
VIGTCGLKRSPLLPDVPTVAESGVPGYEASAWWGLLAPAGTPAPIVERLSREIKEILVSDELKKFFQNEGAEMDYLGPAEFGKFIAKDINKWVHLVKEVNIKAAE